MGPWAVLAFGADGRNVGVLVRGGIGAFPFDTGGVGSELVCTGAWVRDDPARMAGLAGQLIVWSFWIAEVTVVSACSNNCSTLAVSSSVGLSGVSEALVPWIWTVLLLRNVQQFRSMEYLTSFPWYCPVPLNIFRLSILSWSRYWAVRSSSEICSLSSKYRQGCDGPALQNVESLNWAKRKRCPWSVAAK